MQQASVGRKASVYSKSQAPQNLKVAVLESIASENSGLNHVLAKLALLNDFKTQPQRTIFVAVDLLQCYKRNVEELLPRGVQPAQIASLEELENYDYWKAVDLIKEQFFQDKTITSHFEKIQQDPRLVKSLQLKELEIGEFAYFEPSGLQKFLESFANEVQEALNPIEAKIQSEVDEIKSRELSWDEEITELERVKRLHKKTHIEAAARYILKFERILQRYQQIGESFSNDVFDFVAVQFGGNPENKISIYQPIFERLLKIIQEIAEKFPRHETTVSTERLVQIFLFMSVTAIQGHFWKEFCFKLLNPLDFKVKLTDCWEIFGNSDHPFHKVNAELKAIYEQDQAAALAQLRSVSSVASDFLTKREDCSIEELSSSGGEPDETIKSELNEEENFNTIISEKMKHLSNVSDDFEGAQNALNKMEESDALYKMFVDRVLEVGVGDKCFKKFSNVKAEDLSFYACVLKDAQEFLGRLIDRNSDWFAKLPKDESYRIAVCILKNSAAFRRIETALCMALKKQEGLDSFAYPITSNNEINGPAALRWANNYFTRKQKLPKNETRIWVALKIDKDPSFHTIFSNGNYLKELGNETPCSSTMLYKVIKKFYKETMNPLIISLRKSSELPVTPVKAEINIDTTRSQQMAMVDSPEVGNAELETYEMELTNSMPSDSTQIQKFASLNSSTDSLIEMGEISDSIISPQMAMVDYSVGSFEMELTIPADLAQEQNLSSMDSSTDSLNEMGEVPDSIETPSFFVFLKNEGIDPVNIDQMQNRVKKLVKEFDDICGLIKLKTNRAKEANRQGDKANQRKVLHIQPNTEHLSAENMQGVNDRNDEAFNKKSLTMRSPSAENPSVTVTHCGIFAKPNSNPSEMMLQAPETKKLRFTRTSDPAVCRNEERKCSVSVSNSDPKQYKSFTVS